MLSEKVLEELVRATDLQQYLVSAAWPNLSTESRLQVLQAVIESTSQICPDWLAVMALDDPAEIVRYLAARSTLLQAERELVKGADGVVSVQTKASPEREALRSKVANDPSPLVRTALTVHDRFNLADMTESSQLSRLLSIRAMRWGPVDVFISWLSSALDAGVDDQELAACAAEFFSLPSVKTCFISGRPDPLYDWDAHSAGKIIDQGWDVARRAGPALQAFLAGSLPTTLGPSKCSIETLASMPEGVLRRFLYRWEASPEIDAVLRLMREEPSRFPSKVTEALPTADDRRSQVSPTEVAKKRGRASLLRSDVVLDAVLSVQDEVRTLAHRLDSAPEGRPLRRWFS